MQNYSQSMPTYQKTMEQTSTCGLLLFLYVVELLYFQCIFNGRSTRVPEGVISFVCRNNSSYNILILIFMSFIIL